MQTGDGQGIDEIYRCYTSQLNKISTIVLVAFLLGEHSPFVLIDFVGGPFHVVETVDLEDWCHKSLHCKHIRLELGGWLQNMTSILLSSLQNPQIRICGSLQPTGVVSTDTESILLHLSTRTHRFEAIRTVPDSHISP